MITPKFKITQDNTFITITIHVPHIKISESEIYIEQTEFKFYLKPYYLRLNFPREIEENGTETAQYDVNTGDVVIKVPKKNPDEYFPDLNMITKLLAPKSAGKGPKIEVLEQDNKTDYSKELELNAVPEDFTWEWNQEYPVEEDTSIHVSYGFGEKYNNYYCRFVDEYPELLDLPNPDQCLKHDRKTLLEVNLDNSFDLEQYIADFGDINEFAYQTLHYEPQYRVNPAHFSPAEDEHNLLYQLPRSRISVPKPQLRTTLIGVVDLLFSFVYDHLISCGDPSVESPWNICKLSAQLSWLYTPSSLKECLTLSCTRAVTYPLYRNFQFCVRVLEDVKFIVSQGRPVILKCLLGLFDVLRKHEFYYLHNNVYIKDYCLWIQFCSDKHIEKLDQALKNISILKSDIPFPLEQFETIFSKGLTAEESESEYETETESDESESSSEASSSEAEESEGQEIDIKDTSMAVLNDAVENLSIVTKDNVPQRTCLIEELN